MEVPASLAWWHQEPGGEQGKRKGAVGCLGGTARWAAGA